MSAVEYEITFTIMHPSIDPQEITKELAGLAPAKTAQAGIPNPQHNSHGEPRVPTVSVWSARLHDNARLSSDDVEIPELLWKWVDTLSQHGPFFKSLSESGDVYFHICIFTNDGNHAFVLDSDLLTECGRSNIAVAVDIYFVPQRQVHEA